MYTLREVREDQVNNKSLGNGYSFVGRFEHKERFREVFENFFSKNHWADPDDKSDFDTENVTGFILSDNNTIPIYNGKKYYVMSESGQTFERIN